MKKKIWFINQAAGSVQHGMVFRTYYLALEMVKLGHEVTIFSGSFSHNFFKQPEVKGTFTEEVIDGIRYVWVKIPVYPKSKSIIRIISMFIFCGKLLFYPRSSLNKPDAIIVSSPPPIPVLVGWLWSKLEKAKLFFEVRDIWPLSIQSLGGYGPINPFIQFLKVIERFAYARADYVSSVLPKAYLHFERFGMHLDKFVYVPNGINMDDSTPGRSETFHEIQKLKKEGKFLVGYAGTIGIANNLDVLIEAAAKLESEPDLRIAIIGEGAHLESIKGKSKNLSNVKFFTPVSKKEIGSILELLDAGYVGLQKEELFKFGISPNKIFDYMQASLPIVMAIDAGNDLVKEADCGISVPSCEPADIARAIQELMNLSNEQRKNLGEKGKAFVNKNHRYENIVQNYLSKM